MGSCLWCIESHYLLYPTTLAPASSRAVVRRRKESAAHRVPENACDDKVRVDQVYGTTLNATSCVQSFGNSVAEFALCAKRNVA
mgnify:CR=1 FL=1